MEPGNKPTSHELLRTKGTSPTRRRSLSALVGLFFACASATGAAKPNPAALTSVDVENRTSESCQIALEIEGRVARVETNRIGNGLFVFDLAPVVWDGATQRIRPDIPGVLEYRYSQFSRDPLVTRFVVDVEPGWHCIHDPSPAGLQIECNRSSGSETRLPPPGPTVAVVRKIAFTSPVAGFDTESLIDRSLGFTPKDIVRDGLPNFGSVRDDWLGKQRPHKGLDIYVDKVTVQAVAKGKVIGAGIGDRAGGWIKISHADGVETVYVHITSARVKTGEDVARGQPIAVIDGAVGNAIQPQLHFELRLEGQSVDPIPYIFELASEDLRNKITLANQRLAVLAQERASQVQLVLGEKRK